MGLSRAQFPFIRACFKNSEKMANFKLQLQFTLKCQEHNIFTRTVENLHLPQFYREPRFVKKAFQLKKIIRKDTLRYLRNGYYKCIETARTLNNQIRHIFEDAEAIINKCKAVYFHTFNKGRKHYREKIKKLLPPCAPITAPAEGPTLSRDDLVTDMSGALDEEELALLAKGPNYAIKARFDERSKAEIQTQLCRLAYQIRWHNKRETRPNTTHQEGNEQTSLPKFPETNFTCVPPAADDETEFALRGIHTEITRLLRATGQGSIRSNLTRNEFRTLKKLKGKPLVYLPSDKGSEFCVIKEPEYTRAGEDHLSDTDVYTKAKIAVSTIETRINSTWKEVCHKANIPKSIQRSYMARNSKLPEFYHLIKTHKNGTKVKIRPIVACRGGPTAKLAWLMTRVLRPLLATFPAHLASSDDLMEAINRIPSDILQAHPYPVSLDVNALYTSVPPRDAIQALLDHLSSHPDIVLPINPRHIVPILEVIFANTYFTFNKQNYKQVSGLPMGSSISGLLAITFMNRLENGPLNNYRVALYRRYVDDCCILTTNRDEAERIRDTMSQQHGRINFDLELPDEDGVLKLLDFSVKVDQEGCAKFDFYQKDAKKPIFLNYTSALPTTMKESVIRNEVRRITKRSSSNEDREKNIFRFNSVLQLNNYPPEFIDRTCKNIRPPRRVNNEKHFFYLRLPFLSDFISSRISRIFRKYNLPVRLYHRSNKLRYALKRPHDKKCNLNSCVISSSGLCFITMCVYRLECETCSATYIGSTIRPLHIRIKEHHNSPRSSVYSHTAVCGAGYKVAVLARESDCTSLRIREALLIRNLCPNINSRQERDEFAGLLF